MSRSPANAALARAYATNPRQHAARLCSAAAGLLELDIEFDAVFTEAIDELIEGVAATAARQIASPGYGRDAPATHALIGRLSSSREQPLVGLVRDLAELLSLARRERSEYVENRTGAPPYRIGKLLLEYAVGSRAVDGVIGRLTKSFCATACARLPVGCCSIDGYDMGVVPRAMLELQEIEARRRGWTPPAADDKCKFHGARGCVIALFKSPACVGMLCDELVAALRARHPPALLDPFLERLAVLRNLDIDRERVFAAQAAVDQAGSALLRG